MTNTAEIFQFPRREDVDRPEPERSGRGPQVEDGYTRIANELFDEIIGAPVTDRERRVVLAVVRLTYGWNKKSDRIFAEDVAKLTKMHESRVSKVISELVRRNVIFRKGGSRSPITLNKDVPSWEPSNGSKRKAPTKRAESAQNEPVKPAQNEPTYKDRKDTKPSSLRSEGEPSASSELELTPPDTPEPKPSAAPYPDDFEAAWSAYPKRAGGNPKKSAFKAWSARRKQGVPAETMQAGVERYAQFIRAKGDERTEFVMQGQRFFGPNAEYDNDWLPPAARTPQRQDGRMGFAQPMPVGSYGTNDLELPAWARD
ncbi:replication protein [Halomonas sp. XH26]|uniref:replication protein n=1 Tax=Halomonas sp. XH26 TaxID=2557993 RepID=UPI00209CD526|nr:replication protein [Halomonas sp. XH26]UTA78988.1 replication protein [Halomonas sp. XH26]